MSPTPEPPPLPAFSPAEARLALVAALAASLIGGTLASRCPWSEPIRMLAASALLQAAILGTIGFLLVVRRLSPATAFNLRRRYWPESLRIGLLGCAGVLAAGFLLAWTSGWILSRLGFPVTEQPQLVTFHRDSSSLFQALFLVQAVIVAPFAEEMLFRGVLLSALQTRIAPIAAIAASSFLFAAFHLHLPTFLPLVAVAAGCAWVYRRTRSLAAPIVLHAAYNLVNLVGARLAAAG